MYASPFTNIMALTNILNVVSLRQVSTSLKRDVDAYMSDAFNVNKRIASFLGGQEFVLPFRQALKKSSGLLSGSFMVAFFDWTDFVGSDMDIFVPALFAALIAEVLLQAGFNYVPRPWDEQLWTERLNNYVDWEASSKAIVGVMDFFNRDQQNIQIVLTRQSTFDVILSFHSTVVMNAFNGEAAFSIYPNVTFSERVNLTLGLQTIGGRAAIKKYKDRGYELVISLGSYQTFDASIRYVGDACTWTLTFDEKSIISYGNVSLVSGDMAANSWSLREVTLGASVYFEYFSAGSYGHQYFNVVSQDIAKRAYEMVVSTSLEIYPDVWRRLMLKWYQMGFRAGKDTAGGH
ncbi:hypothetical protein C8J56DRAFT_1063909 [Mycena floridula]|nr:hypothetical protein C8J56DRAFT_1063909 [Mycena floridula]